MIRTQVQLTEKQVRELKRIAAARGTSLAEVVRDAVDGAIRAGGVAVDREEMVNRALSIVGRFRSGIRDTSVRHDKYLGEAFRK
jgi:hypothetical protein